MAKQESSEVLMRRNGGLAFFITVLVAYAQWLSSGVHSMTSMQAIVLLILGSIYLGLGITFIYSKIPTSQSILLGYIGVQVILGMIIIYLGKGTTWLVIFPIVSQVVIMMPRRGAWLINGAIYLSALLILWFLEGGQFNWQLVLGLFCGMVFVILFSQIVLSEQNMRNELERLYVELSVANRKLHEYAVKVEELATLQERNRLARDIHDGLGHYLTALNMQIKAAQAIIDQDRPRAIEALTKAQNLAEEALSDVRNSVATLRGEPSLSQPLPEAIESLLIECRADGLVADLKISGNYRLLASEADLTLYRAAQEALTNVRKHALASRVDVTIIYDVDRVCLTVCDNGIGADKLEGGFGLLGLRERVQLLHGQVSVRTAIRQGFCIEVEMPG
jgi:signal transduction histidine kinase